MLHGFRDKFPKAAQSAFIADSADVIGDVELNENTSVWFGAVLRGDSNSIIVGENTNIQDNCVVHASSMNGFDVNIGRNVTIGHGAIIHGCKIGDNSLIGMGAVILNGAEIGQNTLVGAGSLVTQGKKIPEGVLCLGSPAAVVRKLTEDEKNNLKQSAYNYAELAKEYK